MPRKEKETIPYPSLNMENPTPKGLYLGGGGAPKSLQMVIAAMKLKDTYSLEKSYDQPR